MTLSAPAVLDDVQCFLSCVREHECQFYGWDERAIDGLFRDVVKASEELSAMPRPPVVHVGSVDVHCITVVESQEVTVDLAGREIRLGVDIRGAAYIVDVNTGRPMEITQEKSCQQN